jgi:malate dehydrogenase (oxaloacetate-decarboxylating)(NADP+)
VDAAADAELRQELYPFSTLVGNANVYIVPDLNAANMAYKLMARLGGAEAIGPILIGMAEPVQVLQRGSTAADIVNLTAIAVVDAQERSIGKAFSDGISV